jgi:hypothetical protein
MIKDVDETDAYLALKKIMISKINKIKKPFKKSTKYEIVSDVAVEATKYSKMIDTFVDAFMFEPTNTTNNKHEALTYIHYPPPGGKLHPYIKEFSTHPSLNQNVSTQEEEEEVDCSMNTEDDCLRCAGVGEYPHLFMMAEGYSHCSECKVRLCLQCTFQKEKGEKHLCVHCLLPEVAVSREQIQRTEISSSELKDKLRTVGIEATNNDTYDDMLDMYESRIENMTHDETMMEKITAPAKPASYLQDLKKNKISSFDFSEGGDFLVDANLTPMQVLELLKILTSLVTMYKDDGDTTKSKTMKRTYKLVPTTIILFAEAARLHSGYRLVWRCIRHAIDPQTHSIVEASGYVVEYDGELCLLINHNIKASMKSNT